MIEFSTPDLRLRLRHSRDRLATLLISTGGAGVIAAVMAIGVFLALEVLPLFAPARVMTGVQDTPVAMQEPVAWMQVEADGQVTLLGTNGHAWQGSTVGGLAAGRESSLDTLLSGQAIISASDASGPLALGLDAGDVLLVPRDERAALVWSEAQRYALFADQPVATLAMHVDDGRWWLAGLDSQGKVAVLRGDETVSTPVQRFVLPAMASRLALGGAGRLILADGQRLSVWSLFSTSPRHLGTVQAFGDDRRITAMTYLAGGETLLVGDSAGGVRRWLNARGNEAPLLAAEPYRGVASAAIVRLLPLPGQRLALALDRAGNLALYQAVAGQRWQGKAPSESPRAVALGPPGETLWWLSEPGLARLELDADHAQVSWETLWTPVLYEGHAEAQHRWQAGSTGVESEPRFGLAPLAWGTLKAAAWALLFAVPVALGAAMHSAVYMSSWLRSRIRPALELMEALPGVVIGFIAGLMLAPYVERHLAGTLGLVIIFPLGMLLGGALWSRLPHALQVRLPLGWASVWLIPWLALLAWLAMQVSPWLEMMVFDGDLRVWLETRLGLDYASRNAMIVGLAMGFAVIPTIYALAEDALAGVPRSLVEGAQALGATRWQALWRVLLPAASPGIFSAVMIGAGRAVGETMIVLMATGNTALMSWSPFEGLRSAAASIAIELPEAAVGSTHYRLLFLSALLLFVFTFCVNTLAEVVRQRLRKRYRYLGAGR